MLRQYLTALTVIGLAACDPGGTSVAPNSTGPVNAVDTLDLGAIETGPNGRCFARAAPPQQTTIVEELELVVDAVRDANGVETAPAVYRTITRPVTTPVGEGTRFETLCPPQYTPDLLTTMQRALRVRGAYDGPINGLLDAGTHAAILAFQQRRGIESDLLATATAQELGVVAIPFEQLQAE